MQLVFVVIYIYIYINVHRMQNLLLMWQTTKFYSEAFFWRLGFKSSHTSDFFYGTSYSIS
jgi:hypothetical protein